MSSAERPTSSPLRREQATQTRGRIVEAARVVFERQGYEGARIEDIAAEAGVAIPTVYKTLANKRTLLSEAVGAAMTGGEGDAIERQAWFREQLDAPEAREQLRLIARNARRLYDRAGPVLEVVRAAASSHHEIQALWTEINDERIARSRTSAERLASKAELRMTTANAAHTLWVLTSPELYALQIAGARGTPARYERWLRDVLVATLLQA